MLPPQAPPAYIIHTNQSAVDAIERLRTIQDWWVEQQAALPDLPATLDAPDLFLADLDAFWEASVEHTPGLPAIPRRQAFALRLAQTTRDDAALRNNDGTFSAESLALVRAIALHPGGPLPSHLHAHELLAGAQPYAGALVLEDDRNPGSVALFTVEAGWQTSASLQTLYRDVERRLRRQRADSDELPGVGVAEVDRLIDTHFLDTRAIDGDVFDTLARRLVARLRERVARAWTLSASTERRDALHAALNLHTLLDVHGIVRHRDLALAAKQEDERLAKQPALVRDHWRRMAANYRESAYHADDAEAADKLSLEAFTLDALATALRDRGITVPPQDLRVRLSRRTLENGPIATTLSGFAEEELSLLELAYRNVSSAFVPTDGMEVIHADGSARADVSAGVLRETVRGLDLPNAYARHLDEAFGDRPAGRQRRTALTGLLKAQMGFQAAEARLSYYDNSEPRSFRTDLPDNHLPKPPLVMGSTRLEQGFQTVSAVLDHPHPNGRKRVDGQDIVVHQLTYKGEPLTRVFMIGARASRTSPRVVLYTPDAPDGIVFREFADRDELTSTFLLNRRFEAYLLAHLPDEFGEPDPKGVRGSRRFKVLRLNDDRTLDWVFPFLASSCQNCTELAEAFVEREVTTDIFDVAYNDTIALAKRNADDATRSTWATDASAAWDVFWKWNPPVQLTRELVGGVVRSVPRTAQAAWRFYDHAKAGESTEAFLAFVDGYTAGLNVLPLYTQVPALAGARVRTAFGSQALTSSRRNLPASDTLFPKKHLAKDVSVSAVEPASGVFNVVEYAGARTGIIRQDGKFYHVRFDKAHECWRLDQPGNAAGYGPAIERGANGRWHYRKVGLRGGNPYEDLYEVRAMLTDGSALNAAVATLSESQRVVLVRTLHQSLPFDEFARTLRARVPRLWGDEQLTLAQEQAWVEALQTAKTAPSSTAPASTTPTSSAVPQPPRPRPEPQPGPSRPSPPAAAERPITLDPAPSGDRIPRAWTRPVKPHQRIPRESWPTHVYAYLAPGRLARGLDGNEIALGLIRNTDNVVGLPVTTLPPETAMWEVPMDIRRLLPPRAPEVGTLGKASGGWVRIDLDQLPAMHPWGAIHRYHLYRVPGVPSGYYLRWTDAHPARQGWTFSDDSLKLTANQYRVGFPSP